ncbi:MAG: TRAP transporter permease [Desulfovibrio sp.]|jgi:TRAP transporter 4TM/12TM fusion protein|nr:TRAP transporter permease [Desulfovibrio sp.]
MPGSAGRQVGIFLKGEDANHKGISDENISSGSNILEQLDQESAQRRLRGPTAKAVFCIALAWSLFQLYTAFFGTFPSTLQRAPHVGAAMTLIFLLYPARRGQLGPSVPWYDYFLSLCSAGVCAYHVFFYEELYLRSGMYSDPDAAVSILAVLLVLESCRRVVGPAIVILAAFFLVYAYFGPLFPGFLAHRGLSIKRIATFEWIGTEGILGTPVYVSSTFIFLFLLFAVFLKRSGVGDWMTGMAMGVCGGATGGPAKAAVIASALQGTISGSSVANTVGTGPVTIPIMKSTGYRKEFAGAVEAASSTGGQLMPPVMGAAAFIMTEYIGCSYGTVALAACIPALLYFVGIFTNVHFEALKHGLHGLPKEQLPDWRRLLRENWYMISPVAVIAAMLSAGYTPMRAALFGTFSAVAVWIVELARASEVEIVSFLKRFIAALQEGARSAVGVAAACACAGIIVGVVNLSGLGMKMAGGIVGLADGLLIPTMLLTALCSLLLGMGVPTTANYIIQATISVPAMIQLGVEPVAAHMFVFYFGIVADITPPVALAAFAGAGIAGGNPMKTGFEAFRLGIAAYIVPFIFVMSPVLAMVYPAGTGTAPAILLTLKAAVTSVAGIVCLATGLTGYFRAPCPAWGRILLAGAGFLLIDPGTVTDIVGLFVLSVIFVLQGRRPGSSAGAGEDTRYSLRRH